MQKPTGFINITKWFVWRHIVQPVFPWTRDTLIKLHILHHAYRQNWHIGWITPGKSITEFTEYLKTKGFSNHFIAWIDPDEVVSLRIVDNFNYQYHLRVFKDKEVRGHYEKTPEAHPIKHFNEDTFEPRTEQFKAWLGDWIVSDESSKFIPSHLELFETTGNTNSQSAPATSR